MSLSKRRANALTRRDARGFPPTHGRAEASSQRVSAKGRSLIQGPVPPRDARHQRRCAPDRGAESRRWVAHASGSASTVHPRLVVERATPGAEIRAAASRRKASPSDKCAACSATLTWSGRGFPADRALQIAGSSHVESSDIPTRTLHSEGRRTRHEPSSLPFRAWCAPLADARHTTGIAASPTPSGVTMPICARP